MNARTVKLHDIAHGRSGDKGNRLNVNIIAYRPEHWPVLLAEVTEARVAALFAHRGATRVTRYELPRLGALNFVIDDALEGGVNSSLALDTHGKCLSYLVLGMDVRVPVEPGDGHEAEPVLQTAR
ncbi:AtuA-related protein [Devosia ginsengisoli]|uniref:AtuA-like ferredoxin-fold domain-containing protein n=1 Tax=Devosia ginsengisoli TaxID=400770 RepID=A0A5B8LZ55_9HYPH|nr:hypothetical protein [Devosia ginsengisoli]QDZ12650.1 hypothetical protein FPZ08_18995 [Devosia ginsengisoli]